MPRNHKRMFRIAWGALVSTHEDLDNPNRQVIGGIRAGHMVEAVEIKGNRVKIERPPSGWTKEAKLSYLPEEDAGWISIVAQDGTRLLTPCEGDDYESAEAPLLSLNARQARDVT